MTAQLDGPSLPDGWVWATLDKIIKIIDYRGRTPPYAREGIPHLRSSNVRDGVANWNDLRYVSEETFQQYMTRGLPEDGDLLFTTEAPLGEVALAPTYCRFSIAQRMMLLRPNPLILKSEFLLYQIMSERFQILITRQETGSVVTGISSRNFRPIPIYIAPLNEQHRIVAAIETQFTRLDAAVTALKRSQANLKRYRAAVLKAACEGRLVPTEAELAQAEGRSYEPASVLLERILAERRHKWEAENPKKKYQEPVAPDTSALLELPEGWCWATVEQLADHEQNSITDGPFGSKLKTSHYTEWGPRVIRLQNIGDGIFHDEYAHISEEHFNSLIKHQVFAGDIVIAALGTELPRACIIPSHVGLAIVKADCMRFKPHPKLISTAYAKAALNSKTVRKIASQTVHGIGRPRLNQQEVKEIVVPLPPLAEQHRIVAEVERRLSLIDQLEKTIKTDLARANRLRQSILKRAFAGQLVPQDPNDEPAAVLLERIRTLRNDTQIAQLSLLKVK